MILELTLEEAKSVGVALIVAAKRTTNDANRVQYEMLFTRLLSGVEKQIEAEVRRDLERAMRN